MILGTEGTEGTEGSDVVAQGDGGGGGEIALGQYVFPTPAPVRFSGASPLVFPDTRGVSYANMKSDVLTTPSVESIMDPLPNSVFPQPVETESPWQKKDVAVKQSNIRSTLISTPFQMTPVRPTPYAPKKPDYADMQNVAGWTIAPKSPPNLGAPPPSKKTNTISSYSGMTSGQSTAYNISQSTNPMTSIMAAYKATLVGTSQPIHTAKKSSSGGSSGGGATSGIASRMARQASAGGGSVK